MKVNLGSIEKIPIGQGVNFIVQDVEISVFRSRSGGVWAVESKCPHKQGPLYEGILSGAKVTCPLHAHVFDLTTGKGAEEGECVRCYDVSVEQGEIFLQFEPPPDDCL